MSKLKIIFFGTPSFVVPVLQNLAQNFNLVGVVTAPDQKVGRKQLLTPTAVKLASEKLGLPKDNIFTPNKLNEETTQKIKNLQPELIVVAAFGKIIPQAILDIPKYGALNIHPSALPKYRGPSPIQEALLNGDKESTVTIMKIDAQMDHGPIVFTKVIILSEQDNFDTLSTKMFQVGAEALVEIIPDFTLGKIKPREQNHQLATFTHHISKEDGYFDINNPPPPEKLDRIIRAYYPWPNAWTKWNGKIVKFYPNAFVQLEGKQSVLFSDFLHGYPDFPLRSYL